MAAGFGMLHAGILFWPAAKLIIWPDSIGYVGPAVDAIEQGTFTHWAGRGSGYAVFLWPLLALRPEPGTIVFAQRLLVLATYIAVAAVIVLLTRQAMPRGGRVAIAVGGFWMATFVLYPPVSGLAHLLMPEVLFAWLLSIVALGIVLHALSGMGGALAVVTVITIVASVALSLVKPHWLAGAVGLPMVLPFIVAPGRRVQTIAVTGLALIGAYLALIVPEQRLQHRYDAYVSRVFGPRTLFCNNSDLIQDHLLRQNDSTSQLVSTALGGILTPEARARAAGWELMGFDGDACTYGEPARHIEVAFAGRPDDEVSFYLSSYLSALASQPSYLVRRLSRHALALLTKPFNATGGEYFLRADARVLTANRDLRPTFNRWLMANPEMFEGLVELPTRPLQLGLRAFFVVAGLALSIFTMLAVPMAVTSGATIRPGLRTSVLGLAFCALAINGLIAAVATFEPRYLAMQPPLFAMLGCASTLVVIAASPRLEQA